MNQRINKLKFTASSNTIAATIPSDPKRLLPGHYLLFVLNSQGVPSIGRVIGIATDVA
jgi:hypothetical protein